MLNIYTSPNVSFELSESASNGGPEKKFISVSISMSVSISAYSVPSLPGSMTFCELYTKVLLLLARFPNTISCQAHISLFILLIAARFAA